MPIPIHILQTHVKWSGSVRSGIHHLILIQGAGQKKENKINKKTAHWITLTLDCTK